MKKTLGFLWLALGGMLLLPSNASANEFEPTVVTTKANDLLVPAAAERLTEKDLLKNVALRTETLESSSLSVAEAGTHLAQADDTASDAGIPGTFSGTVSFTTNYVFRGLTQSDNNPAVQGSLGYSLDLSEDVGVFAGVFGSSVDFNDGDEASIEIDLYTGVAYQPTEKLSTDFTAFYYLYPGASSSLNYDYFEFLATATYDLAPVALGAAASYSPDNFASSGDAFYIEGSAAVPLPGDLTLSGAVGYQSISDNTAFGVPDYLNWRVGLDYAVAGFDLSLQYTDTGLSQAECFSGTDLCDAQAIFTASRSF